MQRIPQALCIVLLAACGSDVTPPEVGSPEPQLWDFTRTIVSLDDNATCSDTGSFWLIPGNPELPSMGMSVGGCPAIWGNPVPESPRRIGIIGDIALDQWWVFLSPCYMRGTVPSEHPRRVSGDLDCLGPNLSGTFEAVDAADIVSARIAPESLSLISGATARLDAILRIASGWRVFERPLTWESSAPQIAAVDDSGRVTTGAPGAGTIMMGVEELSATSEVEVGLVQFASVSAGGASTCGLSLDDGAYCWGSNELGQLGVEPRGMPGCSGLDRCRRAPGIVPESDGLAWIEPGSGHTCGIDAKGNGLCWGWNDRGQLGDGNVVRGVARVAVAGGLSFSTMTVGRIFTCGLAQDSTAYCWGANDHGQLGIGSGEDQPVPQRVLGDLRFTQIVAGDAHACALTEGGVAYCWGDNRHGQVGDRTTTDRMQPGAVAGGLTFSTLSAGASHSCGIDPTGQAYCWGDNEFGQLGDGTTVDRAEPVVVVGLVEVAQLAPGGVHTCGLDAAGAAHCWGGNAVGVLGNGSTQNSAVPVPVSGGLVFGALSAGVSHMCGITVAAEPIVYCWGDNSVGQLGDTSLDVAVSPAEVTGQRFPGGT